MWSAVRSVAEDAADPERVGDRLAQPVAGRDLEVEQRRLVASDLHHVEHVVGTVERGPALEVRRDRGEAPRSPRDVRAIASAVASRSGSMSCSAISTSRSSGKARMSPSRFFVKTTLPAPMNAIRGHAHSLRRPEREAADELALQQREDDDRRQRDEHRRGGDQVVVGEVLPWRFVSDEVIGRLSPELISTIAQKKSL